MWLDNLRAMKEKSGLTTREISARSNLPEPTLEKIFAGATKDPKLTTIQQLVHFFGYTLDDLDDAPNSKNAPSGLPEEALGIAKKYVELDDHGKGAVKAILEYEGKSPVVKATPEPPAVISMPRAKRNHGMVEIDVYDQPAAAGLGNYLDQPVSHLEQYPADVIPPDADFGVVISGDSMEPRIHDGGTVFVQAAPSIDPGKIGVFVLNGKAYCKKLAVDHDNRQVRLVSLNAAYEDIVVQDSDEMRTLGRVLGQWTKGYAPDLFGW